MNCLCCGKALKTNCSEPEQKNQWHNHCVKKFFGTEKLPTLEVTEEQLEQLANECSFLLSAEGRMNDRAR